MKDLGFGNLGYTSIAIIYLVFSFTSSISIAINKKLGTKLTIFFSSCLYTIYIASYLFPAYKAEKVKRGEDVSSLFYSDGFIKTAYLFSSALTGAGAGPLWVSL
jgi:hypothetical protein